MDNNLRTYGSGQLPLEGGVIGGSDEEAPIKEQHIPVVTIRNRGLEPCSGATTVGRGTTYSNPLDYKLPYSNKRDLIGTWPLSNFAPAGFKL